jgi:hypothetical protein
LNPLIPWNLPYNGGKSRKTQNNWDEIAIVFIQVEVYHKRILDQSEGGGMGRGVSE